jgi:hypothetical protein
VWSRRAFGSSVAAFASSSSLPVAAESPRSIDLSAIPISIHEQAMRLAIAEARGNSAFPFGAAILRAADRHVMATGVNTPALPHHAVSAEGLPRAFECRSWCASGAGQSGGSVACDIYVDRIFHQRSKSSSKTASF